jgi:hypothetical protein
MQTQPEKMSFSTFPFLPHAIDLIQESVRGINPLTIERERSKGSRTETEGDWEIATA